jgi:hypothetical protein
MHIDIVLSGIEVGELACTCEAEEAAVCDGRETTCEVLANGWAED